MYKLLVGNLGMVHTTHDEREARTYFEEYVGVSKAGIGRAANEPVTLFCGNEIVLDYTPATATVDA